MAFVDAMDASQPTHTLGENASLELTAEGVGEARTALFAALTRGVADERVSELAEAVVREAKGDAQCLVDLVVIAFQTRDCRGGKGEKALFYRLAWEILGRWPNVMARLLPLVPEYGSWRDVAALWEAGAATDASVPAAARAAMPAFRAALEDLFAARLKEDLARLDEKTPSLAGKYAPREGKRFAALGKVLAGKLFPGERSKADYRKAVAKLSAALAVPEQKMCGKRWAEIDVAAVPSRCLAKSRKAFLNEKLKRTGAMSAEEEATGDRHPDDADRVACRAHVREAVLKKAGALKGKQLFPHEIVRSTTKSSNASTLEDDVANAQWAAIMRDLEAQLAEAGASSLGKLVPLSDVSGSMSGVPMEVSIALGVIVSDLAAEPFKHRVLTFESEPRWHPLAPGASPTEKIRSLKGAPWGGSTDFEKAMNRILEACQKHRLLNEEVPDLIVFSDMQFDQAMSGSWETHHARLVTQWRAAGYELPTITYWNLRGDTQGGFMAAADAPGVRLLSGFSPALLKLVLTGEEAELEETVVVNADGTTTVAKAKPNPYQTLRKALDAPRYDAVRVALAAETTGAFADYGFVPAADEDAATTAPGGDFEMVDAD